MNKLISFVKKNYVFLSPFLISLYTVLFLFAQNLKEYRLEVLLTPLVIAISFAAIVLGLSKLIFRRNELAIIISCLVVFICLSYGRFLELGENAKLNLGFFKLGADSIVGTVVVLSVLVILVLVLKLRRRLHSINKFIIVLTLALLVFPLFSIISFELQTGRIWRPALSADAIPTKNRNEVKDIDSYPDIYYFIFDRYAGARSLSEQYKFDNSDFLNFLKNKGFYVTQNSTTNYPKTFLSLGSSLNMEYLDDLTKQTNGGATKDESLVTPLMRNNKVMHFLKDHGYTYVHMGSWWEPTKKNINADVIYSPRYSKYWNADEFTTGFFNLTIASKLLQTVLKDPSDVSKDPHNNSHRQAALFQFKNFKKIPPLEGPKFVFVHVLLPHDPFVFDKDCNPIAEETVNKNSHQVNYINQLQCTNKNVELLVNEILESSKNPPVIILQSDEGPFPMNSPLSDKQEWDKAGDQTLREKFPILNAYYFPDKDTSALYNEITPVNSFRVVLNKYFNENLPLLPDKNFIFQDENNVYKFTDVTSKVRE